MPMATPRANTAQTVINQDFGFNPGELGNLTPHSVRSMAIARKNAGKQQQLGKQYVSDFKEYLKLQVEIQKLKTEATKAGIQASEQVAKELKTMEATAALYLGKIRNHGEEARLKVTEADQEISNGSRVLQSQHSVNMAELAQRMNTKLQSISERRQLTNLQRYMKADDYSPFGIGNSNPIGSLGGSSRRGGFMGWLGF